MLKIKIKNKEFEILKDIYVNDRVALYLYNSSELINLTINVPEAVLISDVIEENSVSASILNHVDGYNYAELIDIFDDKDIITSYQNGEIHCGFNHYKGIIINDIKLNKMRNLKRVI